jgi:hypothetical protein
VVCAESATLRETSASIPQGTAAEKSVESDVESADSQRTLDFGVSFKSLVHPLKSWTALTALIDGLKTYPEGLPTRWGYISTLVNEASAEHYSVDDICFVGERLSSRYGPGAPRPCS